MSGNQLYTYVDMRLMRCGVWARSGGFPGPKPMKSWWASMVLDRNVKRTADPERAQPVDVSEAEKTYACVLALGDPLVRAAVFEAYFKGGTVEQKAKSLRCCVKTYYNRLERGYAELLGYMNDVEAGIPLPVRETEIKNNLTELQSFRTFVPIVA